MPIEFRCIGCQKLLRTGDDTAGLQAQCPNCGATMVVPMTIQADLVGSSANGTDPSNQQPGNQPNHHPANFSPPPAGMPMNPYQPPEYAQYGFHPQSIEASREYARRRLAGPAIALMCLSGLIVVMTVLSIIGRAMDPDGFMKDEAVEFNNQQFVIEGAQVLTGIVIAISLNTIIFFGAYGMRRSKSYGFSLAASILAMIPCVTSFFCLIGLPFGIWAVVVLSDSHVKASFR